MEDSLHGIRVKKCATFCKTINCGIVLDLITAYETALINVQAKMFRAMDMSRKTYYHLRSNVKCEHFFVHVYFHMRQFSQATVIIGPMKMFCLQYETMNVCFIVSCSKRNSFIGPIVTVVWENCLV